MPYDEDQIENLEAELDDLVSPTTHDVLRHSQDYDAGIVAAVATKMALTAGPGGATALDDLTDVDTAGGQTGDVLTQQGDGSFALEAPAGGSQPGAAQWIGPLPFVFNTPGLNAGIAIYTPRVGDWLIDVQIVVAPDYVTDLPWDGTTPLGDVGYVSEVNGFFALFSGALDMTLGSSSPFAGDQVFAPADSTARLMASWLASSGGLPNGNPLPWRFQTADPLAVWVSQDGAAGGAAPGASQGIGAVYLCISTPDAP